MLNWWELHGGLPSKQRYQLWVTSSLQKSIQYFFGFMNASFTVSCECFMVYRELISFDSWALIKHSRQHISQRLFKQSYTTFHKDCLSLPCKKVLSNDFGNLWMNDVNTVQCLLNGIQCLIKFGIVYHTSTFSFIKHSTPFTYLHSTYECFNTIDTILICMMKFEWSYISQRITTPSRNRCSSFMMLWISWNS